MGERFPTPEQTPGPCEYNLPEVHDPCAAVFGKACEERLPDPEQTPGPGAYDLPEVPHDPCNAVFGKACEERFRVVYDLPTIRRDPCGTIFGKAEPERCFPTPEQTPGAGDYDLHPIRDSCAAAAAFGKSSRVTPGQPFWSCPP